MPVNSELLGNTNNAFQLTNRKNCMDGGGYG